LLLQKLSHWNSMTAGSTISTRKLEHKRSPNCWKIVLGKDWSNGWKET